MPAPSASQQLASAQQQLLNAYVQRDQLRKQLEQTDTQITAFTNLLAGAQLATSAAAELPPAVVAPTPAATPVAPLGGEIAPFAVDRIKKS